MSGISGNQAILAVIIVGIVIFNVVRGYLTRQKIKKFLDGGALVIDVRSPGEYDTSHFSGSLNIPHDKIEKNLKIIGTVDQKIVVYCASGSRSSAAVQVLRANGYIQVLNAGSLSKMP